MGSRRRLVPVGVLTVFTALVAGTAALGAVQAPTTSKAAVAHTPVAPVAPSVSSTTTTPSLPGVQFPPRGADVQGPAAVAFIDANQGWVLKWHGCDVCASLIETRDGGRTWSALPPLPAPMGFARPTSGSVTDVYFSDAKNGFLFGPGLYATHDGGMTWHSVSLSSVQEVTSADGYAYALTGTTSGATRPWSLFRSPIATDTWAPVALPGYGPFRLSARGSMLVLLEPGFHGPGVLPGQVGGLWESTDGGITWTPRRVPCTPSDGGAAVATIALGHQDAWLLDCFDNEQSSEEQQTQHHLYGTADAGQTWVRLGDPSHTGAPVSLADNGNGHAVLTVEGLTDLLMASSDHGVHWAERFGSGGSFSGWADLGFVSASTGFVVAPRGYLPEHLYRTDDGGVTWHVVPIGR